MSASMTFKPLHGEISIASANTVNGAPLVRIINTSGSTQVLVVANSGGQYANLTILNNNLLQNTPAVAIQVANFIKNLFPHGKSNYL